jgi:glyoxylase-like metal-dependent hydrolase (beta-lactamase superfamily II)
MKNDVPKGIYQIRGLMGVCHLLVNEKRSAVLIDTGLVGERGILRRALNRLRLEPSAVEAILLTHGHLDHAGNLAKIKTFTGAPIFAHPAEQAHINGSYPYSGTARVCGALERVGRAVLRYRSATIDSELKDGVELPFWGGLRVVHLPGHTQGHCGFYSERHNLLFSGDLFASYFHSTHLPPAILNSCPEFFPPSLERVVKLNPKRMLPNHYDLFEPLLHRARFDKLYRKVLLRNSKV